MSEMLVKERTNYEIGFNFINPLNIKEKLLHCNRRPIKYEKCDSDTSLCPNCSKRTKLTSNYDRVVYHLSEAITYNVYYYYCYTCKLSWPSIPVDCLPNFSLGIDVIGHIAKYHVLQGQSFLSISTHLQECHGINRSVNSIRNSFYRFEILCQKAHKLFETAIQAYFEIQEVKFAIFDEAFYKSLYNSKLCVGILLLPEIKVIAGISVSKEHNQKIIRQVMSRFRKNISNLDVIGVDLAPMYTNPITEVFTAVSIQYCVFHFFQILFRNIVNPFAIEVKQMMKEQVKEFRNVIEEKFSSLRQQIPGKFNGLIEEIKNRFNFCLKKRYPNYLIIEFENYITELFQAINESRQSFDLQNFINTPENAFLNELNLIAVSSRSFLRKLKKNTKLIEFQEVFDCMNELKSLFQLSDEKGFNEQFQEIERKCNTSSNTNI
jgi:hypothetical protein